MKSIEPFHPDVRIGDFVGLMIFANYLKVIEGIKHLIFNIECTKQYIHPSLNIETLFDNVIDKFIVQSDQIALIPDCERRGSGCIWIAVPALVAKFGDRILPKLNFDEALYTGPAVDDDTICFSPLFNGTYNQDRGMSDIFCNDLINNLEKKYGKRLLVITDQPKKITNKNINCYVDDNLYNLIYMISKCYVYIGGDTGFTHFAGLCRPRGIVSIYEPDQLRNFNSLRHHELYPLSYWNSDPVIDRSKTILVHLNMKNHTLPTYDSIYQLIDLLDKEKEYIKTGEWE